MCIYIYYIYIFLKYACARKHSAHTHVDGLLFSAWKTEMEFPPKQGLWAFGHDDALWDKQTIWFLHRSQSQSSKCSQKWTNPVTESKIRGWITESTPFTRLLTLWKHTLSGLRNALIPSNSVGHEQFEDLGLSGFSAAGGPKIMSFDEKGIKVLDLRYPIWNGKRWCRITQVATSEKVLGVRHCFPQLLQRLSMTFRACSKKTSGREEKSGPKSPN